jgi:hypothetical protein
MKGSKKALVVAAVALAPIFASSGNAFAAGLPSQAPITASGTATWPLADGYESATDMLGLGLAAAETDANSACSSGAIRLKHLVITGESFWQAGGTEYATVTIYTRCW